MTHLGTSPALGPARETSNVCGTKIKSVVGSRSSTPGQLHCFCRVRPGLRQLPPALGIADHRSGVGFANSGSGRGGCFGRPRKTLRELSSEHRADSGPVGSVVSESLESFGRGDSTGNPVVDGSRERRVPSCRFQSGATGVGGSGLDHLELGNILGAAGSLQSVSGHDLALERAVGPLVPGGTILEWSATAAGECRRNGAIGFQGSGRRSRPVHLEA